MGQKNSSGVSRAALTVLGFAFLVLVTPYPAKAADVSGTYVSEITANIASYSSLFEKDEHRNLVIVIEQDGNEITGYNDEYNLKITGTLEGDTISFFTWPSDISMNEIEGEWKVDPDGKSMEGSWRYGGTASGKWNLTKGNQVAIRASNADSPKMQRVAAAEAASLSAPKKPLSNFAQFELEPVILSDAIRRNVKKANKARELERKLQSKLTPLLNQWNAASGNNASGKLLIRPHLQKLRIVSGGAKFWGGVFTGSSFIDMELVLVDAGSDKEVSRVLIKRSSTQDVEFTLTNKNDERVIDYVVSIAYEYLAGNNDLTNSPTLADVLEDDGNQASVEFIGIAASEIASKTYDEDLWHQSGKLAKGDAEKQSGIYIKLRSKRLAEEDRREKLKQIAKLPGGIFDISGTYVSEITSTGSKTLPRWFRHLEITLDQSGNKITGSDKSGKVKLHGILKDNTIDFYMLPNEIIGYNDSAGNWKFSIDGKSAGGTWEVKGGRQTSGNWNLTRIE